MNEKLPIFLCAILLLLGATAGVVFRSSEARSQGDGIIVDGEDDKSIITNEYSSELENVTSEVTARAIVEYSDFSSGPELKRSSGLDQAADTVSSRVVVEYADSAPVYESQQSVGLQQSAAIVTSRIIVEYADFIFSPNLGPKPMNDTTPPNIGTPVLKPLRDNVTQNEIVTISVDITDTESGVKNATLQYSLNNTATWTAVVMGYNLTSQRYYATILGQSEGTYVRYNITAYDNAENLAAKEGEGQDYTVIPEFPSFLILPTFMIATLLAVVAYRRKRVRQETKARVLYFVGKQTHKPMKPTTRL
jgi:hypothetical protein